MDINELANLNQTSKHLLNQILYGPPGTGKTYNAVLKAMSIIGLENCFKDWFRKNSTAKDIEGTLNRYIDHIYKINEEYLGNNIFSYISLSQYNCVREGILNSDYIKNDPARANPNSWYKHALKRYGEFLKKLTYNDLKNEFDKLKEKGQIEFVTFHQSYSYEEFVEGIKPFIREWGTDSNKDLAYIGNDGIFKNICNEAEKNLRKKSEENNDKYIINPNAPRYVLIIDEINRGNISKIFGELITLIEEDKRIGNNYQIKTTLPYSKESFGVPKNLYILGTMNTSDRSIASIDIALRRRFKFVEMMPNSDLVADFKCNFKKIFESMNTKIKILLDRDHQIGHSYFIKTKYENADIETLKEIWFDSIIPLLNEYFYGDWEKLQAILGEAREDENSFISRINCRNLFNTNNDDMCDETYYDFNYNCNFEEAMRHAFDNLFPEVINVNS